MEIKVKKTKANFELRLPIKSAFAIETPDDMPKLHQLMIISGHKGSGKLIQIVQFVGELVEREIIDRVILMTPTYYSNKEGFEPLNINEDSDVLEPTKENISKIDDIMNQEAIDYEEYIEKEKKYKQFKKMMKSRIHVSLIPPEQLLEYDQMGFFAEPPKWKYKHVRPPRVFLIIDDAVGTEIMNPKSGLLQLCIRHRHTGKMKKLGGSLGISIALLTQSYSTNGGIPRAVRENCSMLLLGKTKDENQIEKIHQEIGTDIDLDKFDALYKYATDKPFGFLIIDFSPKDKSKQFRAGWNEFIE
jgi:hypothetical protein